MTTRGVTVLAAGLGIAVASAGCRPPPQALPVVVSAPAVGDRIEWRDAHGPLRGEVPWVVRSDVRGPDTFLVVAAPDGDRCARRVVFRVLAPGETSYTVTLASDLRGRVSWEVISGGGQRIRLFSCEPRPAENEAEACIFGGVPRPLAGELAEDFAVLLDDGSVVEGIRSVRFERGVRCGTGGLGGTEGRSKTEAGAATAISAP